MRKIVNARQAQGGTRFMLLLAIIQSLTKVNVGGKF
jgi:hypothetical protein